MATILVIGGGLSGLASAAALGSQGHQVQVLEMRAFLGGRATSYQVPGGDVEIDNCQHILLRCCVNLLDFYGRLGVADKIEFHRKFHFLEPGTGRDSVLEAGMLPSPLHFSGAFLGMQCLSLTDKIAIGRALLAVRSEHGRRADLDRISMLDWLREKRQPENAIERFWRQVLVSAINEELDGMAASHGLQVFYLGFLASANSYEMGIPRVPLAELYGEAAWKRLPTVDIRFRQTVDRIEVEGGRITGVVTASGERFTADTYISALPFERLAPLMPALRGVDWNLFQHSPITGIHLWFDRPITTLPHATLLNRTIQWMYNKHEGRHVQLVVSASRSLTPMARLDVIDLALRELAEFFPLVREAKLEKAHVVKEVRATFVAAPGLEEKRPGPVTEFPNFFLAGDWTRSGWPATMEGAVRSGYIAADAANRTLGVPNARPFLLPDIA